MNHTIAFIKRVLSRFWSSKTQVDYLEVSYELLDHHVAQINEEELGRLMAKRDMLRKRKKKWTHVQKEIERMKAKQILNAMRAK